jgi:DNA-binding NarL/FixJ family response regulator
MTGKFQNMKKRVVIIVDDHALFRKGLSIALASSGKIDSIREASNGLEFLDMIDASPADVVLMDISMPVMDGITATRSALEKYPELRIIALSMHDDMEHYHAMIDAGVMGFLSKDAALDDVIHAIETVASGQKIFSQDLLYNLVRKMDSEKAKTGLLTAREKEVLLLISSGLSNQEIADKLFLSKMTVDKHRENILLKTQTKNTADLIMFAIKNKLI